MHNTCLDYLTESNDEEFIKLAKLQYDNSNCMTDKIAALSCLMSIENTNEKLYDIKNQALNQFYIHANNDPLVLNKWFSIQASADYSTILEDVKLLKNHPDFIITNPNRARSLLSVFSGNSKYFHAIDGSGYEFIANNIIEIDGLNPQVAARMTSCFSQWKKYDLVRQNLMKLQLERIKDVKGLSKDSYEVVTRCLK